MVDPRNHKEIADHMTELSKKHPDYIPQFTVDQFIKFIHVLFGESVVICDEIIKHYHNRADEGGYIKGD